MARAVKDRPSKKSRNPSSLAAKLVASERAKLEGLLLEMPVGVCLLEGPEHRYSFFNSRYFDLVGGYRNILGKTVLEALPELKGSEIPEILDSVYSTGVPFYGKEFSIELSQVDGSKKRFFLNFAYMPMRDLEKRIYGISVTVTDVTEQVTGRMIAEKSEAKFRALANSMPQIVWTGEPSGQLDYFNQVWFDYSGTTLEDNLGSGWANQVHPEDLPATRERWAKALGSGAIYENEFRLRSADGRYRWFVARALPVRNTDGQIVKWYGTNTDIHAAKIMTSQLEEARRDIESEQQKLRTIIADSSTSMAVLKGKDLIYEILNKSYLELFNNRSLLGKAFVEALPELKGTEFPKHAKTVFATGEPYVDREARAFLRRSDNGVLEERYFDQTYTRMLDQHGKPYGVYIHAHEVTDRVRDRRELEESAERFRVAVDTANMGTWDLDPRTGIVNWSKRTRELFGKPDIEVVQLDTAVSTIHPDDVDRVSAAIAEATHPQGNGNYDIQYRIVHISGETRWVAVRGKAFFADTPSGRICTRFTGNVLDITDRVLAEDILREAKDHAETANIAKSAFLANMSHEIRSPLGAIMGFSDLLKSPDLSKEDLANFVAVIDRNSHHLLRIIDDILDLSKVEAGKMLIEHIDFSLVDLLADFSSLMSYRARDKGILFELRIKTLLPSTINSDPTRLRQILANVVGNAIKFTERGQIQLTVSYDRGLLEFNVRDTGPGIAPEQAVNLFKPFQQADASTTRKFGGTGLGLALTRRLTEALGGKFVLVESATGHGSVFVATIKVSLPKTCKMLDSNSLGFVAQPLPELATKIYPIAGMNLLVVEDSPDNQALLKLILGKAGAKIETANDGYDGVTLALANSYDAILMDVQMPRMDGYEATRILRSKGYTGAIIALTAHAMIEERDRAINAGFSDFLSKPVNRESLMTMLSRYGATIA